MALAARICSRLDRGELALLQRLQAFLERHPYARPDLRASTPLSRELEDVLSARLALRHFTGRRLDAIGQSLLGKLRDREVELVRGIAAEEPSEELFLRYDTALLLHPDPELDRQPSNSERVRAAIERWERERQPRGWSSVVAEKIKQSRDFLRHGAMLPFYWIRRRRIRARFFRAVLRHSAVRETLFAIEQVGPIVDNFAFAGAAGLPGSAHVALADLAFLYMQLADELLDELSAAAGGRDRVGVLVESLYRPDREDRPLRDLSLRHLQSLGVDAFNHPTRFKIALAELFEVLEELGRAIDSLLVDAEPSVVRATRRFLHHCFQTYLDEVELCRAATDARVDRIRPEETAWHFYRKNNLVMMLWLDLRARLLGLDPANHAHAIRRWGYLLASFQIFDDLKDIAIDLGKQPNYALQIAAHEFPAEHAWIEQRFSAQRAAITRDEVIEVRFEARNTVQRCLSWSRFMALAHFDNVLLYAWDQRWRKSWTRRCNSFNPELGPPKKTRTPVAERVLEALRAVRGDSDPAALDDAQLAFALDAAAYESTWQIHLALFPNIRAMYRFATLQMWMSTKEKAAIARRLLARSLRKARRAPLLRLADGDVDHQVGCDGLEAFSKIIEA